MPGQQKFFPSAIANIFCPVLLVCFLCATCGAFGQGLENVQEQFKRGDYEAVIAGAQKNLKNDFRTPGWRVLLVESLLTTGRYKEAYTNALGGVDVFPGSIRLRLLALEATLFQNDPAGVTNQLEDLKEYISTRLRNSQDSENVVAAGEALLLLGVEPRLVLNNFFDRARKLDSPPRQAFLASGQLALEKHDFALAANTFRDGLKKFPDDPDLQSGLARAFENGNREQMLEAINAALETNPHHAPSLLLLVDHLIQAEEFDEAEKQLAIVLRVNPNRPEALAYRAVLAHFRNDSAKENEFRAAALKFWKINPQVDFIIGHKLSQNYRFEEGAAAQRRALALDPNYLPARRQLAGDLLRLGETKEGWKLADAVHKEDAYDVTAYNLVTLRDQMAKFQTVTNEHFIVHMSGREAEIYGDRVLQLLSRARETLCKKYGMELKRPTTVEIFPEQKDFAVATFGMPGNPGYLGVCFGSVITANSPASQAPNPANWQSVLWHEFCHVVTLTATRNRMPRWLSEGISVYEERQANPAWGEQMNLAYREMILNKELTPVGELSSAFLTPKTPKHLQFAYLESSLVVEFFVEQFGLDSVKNILRDLGNGEEINKAIAARTKPLPEIEKQFAAFALDRAEKLAPAADLQKPAARLGQVELTVWREMHPQNYFLQMEKARELLKDKKWAEAKPVLQPLADAYHGEKGAENPLWLLAVAQKNLGETNAELATLEKFVAVEDAFVDLFARLIELQQARKNWPAVTRYAELLLAVNPLLSLPHRVLAEAGVATGQNEQAITGYRKVLLLDPPDPAKAHFELAKLLRARGNAEAEAKREVLLALEDAPRYREAHRLLLEIGGGSVENKPAPVKQ